MQHITSATNPLIKKIKKLGTSKKFRDETGLIVLDGVHLVEEFLKQSSVSSMQYSIVSESFQTNTEYEKFKDLENQILVPDSLLDKIAPTRSPGGIMSIAEKPSSQAFKLSRSPAKVLILDHLQDPGNVGTILRTAVAGGCEAVFLYGCADPWSPKSLRAGQGAQFYEAVACIEVQSPKDIRQKFQGTIYGLSLEDKSQNFFEAKLRDSQAFALGNEGQGLTQEMQEICDEFLYIPMENNFESLNVGVTAGICLFSKQ